MARKLGRTQLVCLPQWHQYYWAPLLEEEKRVLLLGSCASLLQSCLKRIHLSAAKEEREKEPPRTYARRHEQHHVRVLRLVLSVHRRRQEAAAAERAGRGHRSRQLRWKRWRHLSSLISSPSSMQLRQNTHSTASSSSSLQRQLLLLLMTLPTTARLLSAESCRNDDEPLVERHANVLRLRAATTTSTDIGGRRVKSAALMDAMIARSLDILREQRKVRPSSLL
jgi:hypothetical protein